MNSGHLLCSSSGALVITEDLAPSLPRPGVAG